jgi:hypothetical protein
MNVFNKLPNELIYIILQYAGELRILKRKMTRENMYQILNDDIRSYNKNEIITFLWGIVDRPMRTGPTVDYFYYWDFLKVLSAKKDGKNIQYKYHIPDTIVYKFEQIFINDYNHYYLDDEYYLHSFWEDAFCYDWECYPDYHSSEPKKLKLYVERYRNSVCIEVCRLVFPK